MVLVKLKIPTHRLKYCDEQVNEEKLKGNLDALEELQDMASIRSTAYQWRPTRYHDHRVKERILKVEDLVLRELNATNKKEGQRKLAST